MDEPKTCDLRAMLSRFGGVHTRYDASAGLRRSLAMWGRITDSCGNDVLDSPDDRFHRKCVRVYIYAPRNVEWEDKLKEAEGLESACGVVSINANVEPKRFEFDGEEVEEEPVQVELTVSNETFEAISQKALSADQRLRVLETVITLAGNSLPDKNSIWSFRLLRDLDVSENRSYAINSFKICETRSLARWRTRVLPVERSRDEPDGVVLSILLAEARYDISVDRGDVHSISCEGRIINQTGKPHDHADVTVEFREYEASLVTDELPERAFAGEFRYCPKQHAEAQSVGYFWFQLRYVPTDVREILLPLLTQETGTELVLLVELTNKKEDLSEADQELRGNVRWFGFRVRRRLLDETRL